MLPECAHFGFLDWLFYFTGTLIWGFVAACLILVTALASYYALGATIMLPRLYWMHKRAQKAHGGVETIPFKSWCRLWWRLFLGDEKFGSFRHKVSKEIVRWPWPWYRKTQDRHRFDEDDAESLEG